MNDLKDDHRGHTIFTHASGPTGGPWVASYSAWKIEPNNSYRAVSQGTLAGVCQSVGEAHAQAISEAKRKIDVLLSERP